jgi:hypothetical protein
MLLKQTSKNCVKLDCDYECRIESVIVIGFSCQKKIMMGKGEKKTNIMYLLRTCLLRAMVADKVGPSRNWSSPSTRCLILLSVSSTLIVGIGWSEA